MKIKDVTLNNFANFDNITVNFDANLTYLIGQNGAGKSGVGLEAIWFILQGIAEKSSGDNQPLIGERFRFIGNNGTNATGTLTLYDEDKGFEVVVTRKITKSGAPPVQFTAPEGMEISQQWLNDLFNVFMIAPRQFCKLGGRDQAAALGVDVSKFDDDTKNLKTKFTEINARFNAYAGLNAVEFVEPVDVDALREQRKWIVEEINAEQKAVDLQNEIARNGWVDAKNQWVVESVDFNGQQQIKSNNIEHAKTALEILRGYGYKGVEVPEFIDNMPQPLPERKPSDFNIPIPEVMVVDPTRLAGRTENLNQVTMAIESAGTTNAQHARFLDYQKQLKVVEQIRVELQKNKDDQATVLKKRIEYIQSFKFPFSNLTVDDEGKLMLDSKPIREPYFSTGELLKFVPILIATTKPLLKYVFIQEFNLLDAANQKSVVDHLLKAGLQLVIEVVGNEKIDGKNCILLQSGKVVDDLGSVEQQKLL